MCLGKIHMFSLNHILGYFFVILTKIKKCFFLILYPIAEYIDFVTLEVAWSLLEQKNTHLPIFRPETGQIIKHFQPLVIFLIIYIIIKIIFD